MEVKKSLAIILLCIAFLLQGCVAFVASQLGYYEAKEKYSKLYDDYKSEQEAAGQPVEDFKDWLKEQPLSSNEIKVFKYRGVISVEEARGIREREAMETFDKEP